jgi:hypothetical protein
MTVTETNQKDEEQSGGVLGPLFTAGALLVVIGLVRGRKLAIAGGLAAIWADRRTQFGRDLSARLKAALTS